MQLSLLTPCLNETLGEVVISAGLLPLVSKTDTHSHIDVLNKHLNKKYPLYKKRYELVTTRQQGETNVAWAIRVKTVMRNL